MKYKDCEDCKYRNINKRICSECSLTLEILPVNFEKRVNNMNEKKKLYKIWQNVNTGWDTYDSAVVCATSEYEARNIKNYFSKSEWCDPKDVQVKLIGYAEEYVEIGVIVDSFNAG